MILQSLNILNYRNIRETSLEFSPKLNCFVGLNGQGKTNVLDAIYLLSFAKSAFASQDSLNITHGEQMAMVQGVYITPPDLPTGEENTTISCGLRKGVKKQFRRDKKDYPRLIDHIGLIPLVMISPSDQQLIDEGSDERRRFMDVVISQLDRKYLDCLTTYNALLKQRNALLKQYGDAPNPPDDLLEVLEWQMVEPAEYIYKARTEFFEAFQLFFERVYRQIAGLDNPENPDRYAIPENADNPGSPEIPVLRYVSQMQDRDLREAYARTRQRDLILGWTSQGIHKDDLDMRLGEWPLKQVGSQGQQRTFVLAMKLAQALYLSDKGTKDNVQRVKPILLLDDIFDRLDSERVERIVEMVQGDDFGQIFITDTDRQHLTDILKPNENAKIFHVENGTII
ncbi:MAG: DNA replication and repair protein RecF [Paludibacteraceae bacterium]|nr:DNA replication and repair protein RecF [Paludibacteraceae bacterium]MBR1878386.1 DNA replication and repair protein RecF [Paludibacteraceae bacterium]